MSAEFSADITHNSHAKEKEVVRSSGQQKSRESQGLALVLIHIGVLTAIVCFPVWISTVVIFTGKRRLACVCACVCVYMYHNPWKAELFRAKLLNNQITLMSIQSNTYIDWQKPNIKCGIYWLAKAKHKYWAFEWLAKAVHKNWAIYWLAKAEYKDWAIYCLVKSVIKSGNILVSKNHT